MSSPILRAKLRRDLRSKRRQVIAVAATVFIGVGLFVVGWDMYNNLQRSYDLTYEKTNFADVWAKGDQTVATALANVEGVIETETRTSANVAMRLGDGSIQGRIQGLPTNEQPSINQLVIEAGNYLDGSDPNAVLLESHTANNFNLSVGDTIQLNRNGQWFDTTIAAVVASPEWLWVAPSSQELLTDPNEFGIVYVAEELASELAPPGSQQVVARVRGRDADLASSAVTAAYAAGATEVFDRAHHPSDQALQSDVKGFKQMAILFPVLFLGVAALATSVLLGRLIHTQRGEIGMLRAFGFDEGQILRHFATYGLVTTLLGAIPAIVLGTFGAISATEAYTSFLSIPFSSRQLSPLTWLIAVAFSVILGIVAGYLPARAAAQVEPAAAMRPLGDGVTGRKTLVERLLPPTTPSWVVVAVRNIKRQPQRAASTMVGVVLALVMIVSAFVMNDSIDSLFGRQFDEIDQRDLVITLDAAVTPRVLEDFLSVPGVEHSEPYAQSPLLLSTGSSFIGQQLQAFDPVTKAHAFDQGQAPHGSGIVVGSAARDELGLELGDVVLATLPTFGQEHQLTIVGFIDEPIRGFSYVDIGQWEDLTGAPPSDLVLTLIDDDAHRTVRNEVAAVDGVLSVHDQIAIAIQTKSLLAATKFFVGAMLFFAMVMAVALIFNSMTVSIGERESEVATLQANGVGRRWIRRTITLENLVIVAAGVLPGLVLGRILGGLFLGQFSTPQFAFEPEINPSSLAVSAAIIGVAAVVAQFPGLRNLDKLDLPAKVRERNV